LKTLVFNSDEFALLNRFRNHQQVLLLSNAMDASGKAIDQKYML
jgi:hypothetical protein